MKVISISVFLAYFKVRSFVVFFHCFLIIFYCDHLPNPLDLTLILNKETHQAFVQYRLHYYSVCQNLKFIYGELEFCIFQSLCSYRLFFIWIILILYCLTSFLKEMNIEPSHHLLQKNTLKHWGRWLHLEVFLDLLSRLVKVRLLPLHYILYFFIKFVRLFFFI